MWWSFLLAGFLSGAICTYAWRTAGGIASFGVGLAVGEAFAFFVLLSAPPEQIVDEYARYPSFAALAGVAWAVLWWIGSCAGMTVGLALKQLRKPEIQS